MVRRNFLRFGKRSGGFPPLASSLEGERGGEDGEEMPFEEETGEEQQEPLFPPHYEFEAPAKRARNFIRFGRARLGLDGRAEEQITVRESSLRSPTGRSQGRFALKLKIPGYAAKKEGRRTKKKNVKFSQANPN